MFFYKSFGIDWFSFTVYILFCHFSSHSLYVLFFWNNKANAVFVLEKRKVKRKCQLEKFFSTTTALGWITKWQFNIHLQFSPTCYVLWNVFPNLLAYKLGIWPSELCRFSPLRSLVRPASRKAMSKSEKWSSPAKTPFKTVQRCRERSIMVDLLMMWLIFPPKVEEPAIVTRCTFVSHTRGFIWSWECVTGSA